MVGTGASNSAKPAGTAFRSVGICRDEVVINMSFVSSERTETLKPNLHKSLEQKKDIDRFSVFGTMMFRHSERNHGACRHRCRKAAQPEDQIRHDVAALKHFLLRTVTGWLIDTFVPIWSLQVLPLRQSDSSLPLVRVKSDELSTSIIKANFQNRIGRIRHPDPPVTLLRVN